MNQLWPICTTECYLAIKKKKELVHANTGRNFDNFMLCTKAQQKRSHSVWYFLYGVSRIGKSIEMESRLVVTEGWGGGGWGNNCYLLGDCFGLFFGVDEKFRN